MLKEMISTNSSQLMGLMSEGDNGTGLDKVNSTKLKQDGLNMPLKHDISNLLSRCKDQLELPKNYTLMGHNSIRIHQQFFFT